MRIELVIIIRVQLINCFFLQRDAGHDACSFAGVVYK